MATPDEMYDEAVALRDRGDLNGAIAKLNEVLAKDAAHAIQRLLTLHMAEISRLPAREHSPA